ARVLGGDDIRGPQLLDRAGREVAEVADGRTDEDERPRRPVAHSFTSTVSPVLRPQRSNAPAWASIANAAFGTRGETRHGRRDGGGRTLPSPSQNATSIWRRMNSVWT